MGDFLRSLADALRPIHSWRHRAPTPPDVYLRPIVLLIIGLLLWPEAFAVAEMTVLLDLLGATLFLLAFSAAFRLLGISILAWLYEAFVPSQTGALLKMRTPSGVAIGLALMARNGVLIFLVLFTPYTVFHDVLS
jgi:hypothetical protein